MPKRFTFKFRFFSSVIPTFQLCRSKHISDHHVNPTPTSLLNPPLPLDASISSASISTPVPRRRITTPSSSATSVGCSGRLRFSLRRRSMFSENGSTDAFEDDDGKYYYRWEKDEKWHVITVNLDPPHRRKSRCSGLGTGTHSDESNEKIVSLKEKVKWRSWRSKNSSRRRRKSIRRSRCTSSSGSGGFQSDLADEEEETETLVTNSSRSFLTTTTTTAMTSNSTATDYSTELNRYLNTIREIAVSNCNHNSSSKRIKNTFRRRISTKKVWNRRIARRLNQKRRSTTGTLRSQDQRLSPLSPGPSCSRNSSSDADEVGSSARLSSALRRLIPDETVVEGKVRESYAVVKRSEDPYGDFKRSIMEIIVEKGIVDESDLEEMLRCLLSLNEDRHRGDILHAFVDVWVMLFFSDRVYTHHQALA